MNYLILPSTDRARSTQKSLALLSVHVGEQVTTQPPKVEDLADKGLVDLHKCNRAEVSDDSFRYLTVNRSGEGVALKRALH